MSKDYYNILGVEKNASQSDIKKAFHKMAHKYHPDKKDGDEVKFKEANEAYQVLGNEQKRKQYDQFGSAGPQGGFGGGQGFGGFNAQGFDFSGFQQGGGQQFDFGDLGDIFETFMGGGFQRVARGRDVQLTVRLTFKESIFGVKKKIAIPDLRDGQDQGKNKELEIEIPAGVDNGQRMKVQGYGEQMTQGRPGNLILDIMVEKHPLFRKEGRNLVMDLDVKMTDAILGAKHELETVDGKKLTVKIPSGLESGQVLRVKGEGVQGGAFSRGDLYIRTHIIVPKKLSKEAKKAVEKLQEEGL